MQRSFIWKTLLSVIIIRIFADIHLLWSWLHNTSESLWLFYNNFNSLEVKQVNGAQWVVYGGMRVNSLCMLQFFFSWVLDGFIIFILENSRVRYEKIGIFYCPVLRIDCFTRISLMLCHILPEAPRTFMKHLPCIVEISWTIDAYSNDLNNTYLCWKVYLHFICFLNWPTLFWNFIQYLFEWKWLLWN